MAKCLFLSQTKMAMHIPTLQTNALDLFFSISHVGFNPNYIQRSKIKDKETLLSLYSYEDAIKNILSPFICCYRSKRLVKYKEQINNLKVDISLEYIMESISKLNSELEKIRAIERVSNYQNNSNRI